MTRTRESLDEEARLALVGAGAVGLVFGGALVSTLVWGFASDLRWLLVGLGGAVGAAVGIWICLLFWKRWGSLARYREIRSWARAGAIPNGVPESEWRPLLNRFETHVYRAILQGLAGVLWVGLMAGQILGHQTPWPFGLLVLLFWVVSVVRGIGFWVRYRRPLKRLVGLPSRQDP